MSDYESDYEEAEDELTEDAGSSSAAEQAAPLTSGRSTGWLRCCFLLAIAVLALPSVATLTGLSGGALNWVHPELAKSTDIDHLGLHWWAPVEVRGVRVANTREWARQAPPLLTAERVVSRQPLWRIAMSLGRGIELTITQPEVVLLNSASGSNLADAIEDLAGGETSNTSQYPFRITIEDGRVSVASTVRSAGEHDAEDYVIEPMISSIQCSLSTLNESNLLPDLSLIAQVGVGSANSEVARHSRGAAVTTVHPRIAARLDDLAADFQPLQLKSPTWGDLATEVPSIEVRMGTVEDTSQRTMRFAARGVELESLEPLVAQWAPGIRCRGLLSLKGEAVMLGASLPDGVAVRMAARGADLMWRQQSWQPNESVVAPTMSANLAVAIAEDGIVVQTLSAETPFAAISGDGEIRLSTERLLTSLLESNSEADVARSAVLSEAHSAADGQVNVRGEVDLVAISRMLPGTLHLREGLELTDGNVRFAVRTQTNASGGHSAGLNWQAVVESTPLVARVDQQTVRWDSPMRLRCQGPLGPASIELRTAELSGDFGRIHVRPANESIELQGRIDVDRLWSHMERFVDSNPPGLRGDVQVDVVIDKPVPGEWSLRDLKMHADNLRVESRHLAVRPDQSLLKILDGQLSLRGSGEAVQSLAAPWTDLSWLADESRVSLDLDASPPHRLTLVAEARPGDTASTANRRWHNESTFRVTQAQMALDIDTDSQPEHYVIRSGKVRMPGVDAELSGTLESVDGWLTTQLQVDADYDLAVLGRMILSDPTGAVQLAGRQRSQFLIQGAPSFWDGTGPPEAPDFTIAGSVGWDSADIYGLQFGPAVVPFRLQSGQIQTEPVRCSLNGGQLNAMVNYDIQKNQVALASGSRVENIQVSEEIAHRWVSYVAPFLADAADVRGSLSARVTRFQYDLNQPSATETVGTIDIHEIAASPGGSMEVLLQAMDVLRPGQRTLVRDLTMPTQQVQFDVHNGVIRHDQLLMTLSGYHMRSRGAVTFNEQLNLTLDVPLERSRSEPSSRFVSVPVQGTVRRPSIDVARLAQQVGTERIESEINSQLDRGLNRLFDKLR